MMLAALIVASVGTSGLGQEPAKKKDDGKSSVTAQASTGEKQVRSGSDCTRPGGRCNKRKPRKPWFFGN